MTEAKPLHAQPTRKPAQRLWLRTPNDSPPSA